MTSERYHDTSKFLLTLFLGHEFWKSHNFMVSEDFFEAEGRAIYNLITESHEKFEKDLTPAEVEALLLANNPLMTATRRANHVEIIRGLTVSISEAVAGDVLLSAFREHVGTEISNLGLELMDGRALDLDKVQGLLDKYRDGFVPAQEDALLSTEVDDILEGLEGMLPYRFNLQSLHELIPGTGPGNLGIVFAMVETGKSAFGISLSFGPGGFAEQGAKVLYVANEEPAANTISRALSAFSGIPTDNLMNKQMDMTALKSRWETIKNRVLVSETSDFGELERLVRLHHPDIVVVDQLDKMIIGGSHDRDDLKLGEIYKRARRLAQKEACSVIAVSQADATADGRTSLRFSQMAGSKVAKPAEADWIIGIGKEIDPTGADSGLRYLSVSKNKIPGGRHGQATVRIDTPRSQYLD